MANLSMFDAFNARDLEPDQVAQSFVPSTKFDELIGANHVLLIGPRGSGKTTLLKMLSLDALRSWGHPAADDYRSRIDFTGIFVPADTTWREMVDALGSPDLPADCRARLGEAAFGINVLLAATDAMGARVNPPASASPRHAYRSVPGEHHFDELVKSLALNWGLTPLTLSFRGLTMALRSTLADLYSQAKVFAASPSPSMIKLYEAIPVTRMDTIASLEFGLYQFDDLVGEKFGRWALLFDEFEVVPAHIQRLVLTKLRAASHKIVYKVALAPCGPQTDLQQDAMLQPLAREDLTRIMLWYKDKKDSAAFCRDLLLSRTRAEPGLQDASAEEIFGVSQYTGEDDSESQPTQRLFASKSGAWSGTWQREFISLAKKDQSFLSYLRSQSIDVDELDPTTHSSHGDTLRKIAPIVAFRNAYRAADGRRRGRKEYLPPYTGWEAIAAISEGNPRWLIGILQGLFNSYKRQNSLPIARSDQGVEIKKASSALVEKLRAVAIEDNSGITTSRSVYALLEQIGRCFEQSLLDDDFVEEPPLRFEVDAKVTPDVENGLRLALNFGGIVCYQEPDHVGGFSSLKGKQFRLAYMLAPQFHLPVRSGKSRALSGLLARERSTGIEMPDQSDLFNV